MFWIINIYYNGKMPWISNCSLTIKQDSSDCFSSKGHKPMSCQWIFKMTIMLMVLWQDIKLIWQPKYFQNLKVLISIKTNSPMLNKWNQFKLYLQSQGFKILTCVKWML